MPIPAGALVQSLTTVKFVDSIAASPTDRLVLNDGATFRVTREGTDFSPPQMRRAEADNMLWDGGTISASTLANRTITLRLVLQGTSTDDLAVHFQALMAELNRETNILLVQWGSTPLFFRTFRSLDVSVDSTQAAAYRLTVTVPLVAEPFAFGLKQTAVNALVITNDPAAATRPQYVDITGVLGDVQTPSIITHLTNTGAFGSGQWLYAIRRRGTPPQVVLQAEAAAAGADTTVQANSLTFSGAGSNFQRCSFATQPTMATRLGVNFVGTASTDLRGTYRVYLRWRKSIAADVINVRWRTNSYVGSTVSLTTSDTGPELADLGLVSFPQGTDDPIRAFDNTGLAIERLTLGLDAQRVSGSGNLDMDYLLLVPADEELCIVTWPSTTASSPVGTLDGPNDAAYVTSSGAIVSTFNFGTTIQRVGSIPRLAVGSQTNRLWVLPTVGAATDDVTGTTTLTVQYYPLHLVV